MYGFSFYLNSEIDQSVYHRIHRMKKAGFSGLFTSLHIPEEASSDYRKRLTDLGAVAKDNQLDVMVDISAGALEKAGFSLEHLEELIERGITGLRMDDGFSMETVAACSHHLHVGLNASTLSEQQLHELREWQANFSHLSAWHNYYPRPETGLERTWFFEKNQWLKREGVSVQAFIPGDAKRRGPLYEGLPTLEEHRQLSPLAAAFDLQQLGVEHIYVGDPEVSTSCLNQFQSLIEKNTIQLRCEIFDDSVRPILLGVHHNRPDVARDVIRSNEARFLVNEEVAPRHCVAREVGSITLDNRTYGRYMGELQITKRDLPPDARVNVVGRIYLKDCSLLSFIGANTAFEFIEEEENKHGD